MQYIKAKVLPATNTKPVRIKLVVLRGKPFSDGFNENIVSVRYTHTWTMEEVEAMGYERLFQDGDWFYFKEILA